MGGARSPGNGGGGRGSGAAGRASAAAAGRFGANFSAASKMPCGDCHFAAAGCGQGVQGGQRAPVLAGGTGAERGNVSCCGRGVRNSRLAQRTLKPILAVCTLGNSVSAKYRLYTYTM